MSEFDAKPEDIVSKLESSDASVSESKFDWLTELQEESDKVETIEDKENQGIIKMRDRWSNWILFLIVLIVLFDMTLVIFLGSGGMELYKSFHCNCCYYGQFLKNCWFRLSYNEINF